MMDKDDFLWKEGYLEGLREARKLCKKVIDYWDSGYEESAEDCLTQIRMAIKAHKKEMKEELES